MMRRTMMRTRRIGLAQTVGGELHRFDDLAIAGAAADISRDRLDNILARRRVGVLQQRMRGEDHAGRAIAALQAVGLAERVLDHAEFAGRRRKPLDRGDLVAIGLHGEHQAGAHRLAIEQHGAGAAHAVLAAGMGAVEQKILAQRIEQCLARLDVGGAVRAVDAQFDFHRAPPVGSGGGIGRAPVRGRECRA